VSKQFVSFLPAVTAALKVASEKALYAAANEGRTQVLKNLTGSRSGIRYKVPGTNVMYTASAPGEYPASATGRLRSSVGVKVKGTEGYIGTDIEYGLCLEKKPASKGGREWLRPSLQQAKPKMLQKIMKRWM